MTQSPRRWLSGGWQRCQCCVFCMGRERAIHLEVTRGLTAAISAGGRQVLPEQGVVEVAATVEVEEGRDRGGLGEVALALSLGDCLQRAVEARYVGLVVLLVVKLHDLARDMRLECAIVICMRNALVRYGLDSGVFEHSLQGMSGRVALPRTKLVLAMAMGFTAPEARAAARRTGAVRMRVADMLYEVEFSSIEERIALVEINDSWERSLRLCCLCLSVEAEPADVCLIVIVGPYLAVAGAVACQARQADEPPPRRAEPDQQCPASSNFPPVNTVANPSLHNNVILRY